MFLAIYELAMQGNGNFQKKTAKEDEMIEVHKGAKMVDDRYFVSRAEEEKILASMFSSFSPLKLKTFSSKEKKKIVILKKISEEFDKSKHYSEKEINSILKNIFDDSTTIRRYLIQYGFMDRTKNGSDNWFI